MAKLEEQGKTLGEIHKHYNQILKNIFEQDSVQHLSHVDYNDSDLENILKIDVACYKRNVSYILEVFKCEDMLYVSRAMKKSVWLVTDEQYTHIVNPKHLHSELFPYMTSDAINKFSLYIRLNLKNESRVDEFFNYYKDNNVKFALKWLPNCSKEVIENATATYASMIKINILKRLCDKSIKVLQIYIEKQKACNNRQVMEATTFLIKNHWEEYLNLIESLDECEYPELSSKYTKMIMKTASQRIVDTFEKFALKVHLQTFVKFIQPENLAPFLLKQNRNKKLQYWFCEENIKPFILAMPQKNRVEFVKQFLIEENLDSLDFDSGDKKKECLNIMAGTEKRYYWYKYLPFETAFEEIKKLILAESTPSERNSMLKVLLYSAGHNMQYIQILLQHYRNKHINEPMKFKRNFVIALIEQFQAFKFNYLTWKILNEIFISMEVYNELSNNVQFCITVAIVHKILYNETLPEILEKKISCETLKLYRKKISTLENQMIFTYIYSILMKQIKELNISNESELNNGIKLVKNILILLSDWNKDLVDFPLVINKISELVDVKKANSWNTNLSCLYNVKKSWRKHLFYLSLDLCSSEETCLNALKYDPKFLMSSQEILKSLLRNDTGSLKQFLNKIRLYWPSSLAKESISICVDEMKSRSNNKVFIQRVILLLAKNALHDIIKKYVPENEKIYWTDDYGGLLNIRKCIAKFMHTARPKPSLEIVLWYAKGDYLQFAVPSLMAVLYNMNYMATRQQIKTIIKGPVSLRKYGIRIAINKLTNEEIIEMFSNGWKSTTNKSIRADLFKNSFKLLCKEKNVTKIKNTWMLVESFISTLTDEENKEIYYTLAKVNQVPLCVRVDFWKKSFYFLKSLPTKSEYTRIIENVISSSTKFMDIVDVNFITGILNENFKLNLMKVSSNYAELICTCLLFTNNKESQIERYNKIFLPIMELCISSWDTKRGDEYFPRWKFSQLLKNLCKNLYKIVLEKRKVIPDKLFYKIHKYLVQNLPEKENYLLLRIWKFSYTLVNIIALNISRKVNGITQESEVFNTRCGFLDYLISDVIPQFGLELLQYLEQDIKLHSTSIYVSFSDALKLMCDFFEFNYLLLLHILKSILNSDVKESYLVALNLIPKFVSEKDFATKTEIMEIIRLHSSPEIKIHYYNRCSELLFSQYNI